MSGCLVCAKLNLFVIFFAYLMRFQALTLVVEFYLKKLYSTQDLVWAFHGKMLVMRKKTLPSYF